MFAGGTDLCYSVCGDLLDAVGLTNKVRRLQVAGRAREEVRARRARRRPAIFASGSIFVRQHVSDPRG